MGVTEIPWADWTWSPWIGCTRVSEACEHCYMFSKQQKYGGTPSVIRRTKPPTVDLPLRKRRDKSWKIPPGSFVFVCSWSDFFHEDVPAEWRRDAVRIMAQRPGLTFLLLTKRVAQMANWAKALRNEHAYDWSHIWLGVTAENQARADERVPELLKIHWPGKRFVSVEPMLSAVDLELTGVGQALGPCGQCGHTGNNPACEACDGLASLDWVICGGESGTAARHLPAEWPRRLRDQCAGAGVPFFFKQFSGLRPPKMPELDGKVWAERP